MDFIKKINYLIFKSINENIKELNINFNNDIHDIIMSGNNLVLNYRVISYYDYDLRERVNLEYDNNKDLYNKDLYEILYNNCINSEYSGYINLFKFSDIYHYDELYLYNNVFQDTKYYYILILIPILLFTIK